MPPTEHDLLEELKPGGLPKTESNSKPTPEHVVLDLSQLEVEIAKNKAFQENLRYLTDASTLIMESYEQQKPVLHQRHKLRLQVGWHTGPLGGYDRQAAWAHVHAKPRTSEVANFVGYYTEDGHNIDVQAIATANLLEPFRHIHGLGFSRARNKLRYLILM